MMMMMMGQNSVKVDLPTSAWFTFI